MRLGAGSFYADRLHLARILSKSGRVGHPHPDTPEIEHDLQQVARRAGLVGDDGDALDTLGGGLAQSGFRLFMKAGGSQEETRRRAPHGTTYKAESQALIGYEWRIGDSFLALYAGSDTESEQRMEPFGLAFVETRYGARLQGDLWSTPLPGMMLQASAYVSTPNGRLWGRIAPGWRLPPGFYAGPELEAYRERGYRKLRLGLHLTGLRLLGLEWRLSGGWQQTSDRPAAFYTTLGLHWLR